MATLSLILLCGTRRSRGSGAEPVVRSLSGFVAASINGLIGDAVLAGPPQKDLGFIADHAGCAFVEAETEVDALSQALVLSRGTDLLILHAGHVPEIGFIEGIEDLLASGQSARRGWLLRAPGNSAERAFPALAPAVGLVAARRLCADVAVPSFANLLKATRARSAFRLRLRRIA
ncbi:MAG TPA: transposase [Methylovirgula sp.]|nr:transposase [Methylovirgula sp.]